MEVFNSKTMLASDWISFYEFGCNSMKLKQIEKLIQIQSFFDESISFEYLSFCLKSGRNWEDFKAHFLNKYSDEYFERCEKCLISKFDPESEHFIASINKRKTYLDKYFPSLSMNDAIKIIMTLLPTSLRKSIQSKSFKNFDEFVCQLEQMVKNPQSENVDSTITTNNTTDSVVNQLDEQMWS